MCPHVLTLSAGEQSYRHKNTLKWELDSMYHLISCEAIVFHTQSITIVSVLKESFSADVMI